MTAAGVTVLLGVWAALVLTGGADLVDLVPFICAVPLVIYGPARYGSSLPLAAVFLVLMLLWGLSLPAVDFSDVPGADGVPASFLVGMVGAQWIFYIAVFMMGVTQRREVEARDAELARLNRQGRLEMAREIHDALSRSLTVINVQATAGVAMRDLESLERIRDLSGGALAEVRGLISSLRASGKVVDEAAQDKAALVAAMGRMIGGFRDAGLKIDTVFPTGPDRDYLVDRESAVVQFTNYRIFGECLTNVVRHQGTDSRVAVTAMPDFPSNTLHVRVESWAGSQEGRPPHTTGSGVGLTGMRDRVEAIGGTLSWSGSVGHNGHFVVEVRLPIVVGEDAQRQTSRWWNSRRLRRGRTAVQRGTYRVR